MVLFVKTARGSYPPLTNQKLRKQVKKKNLLSIQAITHAPISNPNPIHFSQARTKPGVYRLRKWVGSAAIVVISSSEIFYVNGDAVDGEAWQKYADHVVWETGLPAPDEITKD